MDDVLQALRAGETRLDLSERDLTDDDLAALLLRPELAAAEELDLRANALTAAGARRLAASALRPRALDLGRNDLGDEGVAALAASALLEAVDALDLAHCGVGAAGRDALLRSPHVARVRALDLRGWPFDGAALALLASSGAWPSLEEIDFSDNGLGPEAVTDDDVEALIRAERLPRLRRVVLLPPRIWGSGGEVDVAAWRERLGAR